MKNLVPIVMSKPPPGPAQTHKRPPSKTVSDLDTALVRLNALMADDTGHTESDVWESPTQAPPKTPESPKTPTAADRQPAPDYREAALRKELDDVRSINESIEDVLATLCRTSNNMKVVSQTVSNASTLLNTWTRILSQTEHNQRLILHPSWKGATEDLAEQEAEALERQRASERRAAEELQKQEELCGRREDNEERRRLAAPTPMRGTRGASRGWGTSSRGQSASRGGASLSYRSGHSRTTSSSGRGGIPGSGRGPGMGRGRSRASR